jgi:hypothetical protein
VELGLGCLALLRADSAFSGPRRPPPPRCPTARRNLSVSLVRGESCIRRNWLASLHRGLCLFWPHDGFRRGPLHKCSSAEVLWTCPGCREAGLEISGAGRRGACWRRPAPPVEPDILCWSILTARSWSQAEVILAGREPARQLRHVSCTPALKPGGRAWPTRSSAPSTPPPISGCSGSWCSFAGIAPRPRTPCRRPSPGLRCAGVGCAATRRPRHGCGGWRST